MFETSPVSLITWEINLGETAQLRTNETTVAAVKIITTTTTDYHQRELLNIMNVMDLKIMKTHHREVVVRRWVVLWTHRHRHHQQHRATRKLLFVMIWPAHCAVKCTPTLACCHVYIHFVRGVWSIQLTQGLPF